MNKLAGFLKLASMIRGLMQAAFPFVFNSYRRFIYGRYVEFRLNNIPVHEFVATTEFGARIGGDTASIVEKRICYFNVWEPNATAWISRSLGPGDSFIDVGCHVGYFTLLASKLVAKEGKVVSIEASSRTYSKLVANIARNDIHNVRPVNIAISDSRGSLKFFADPGNDESHNTMHPRSQYRPSFEVECAPLLEVLLPGEFEQARIMKVDVEGAEWRVARSIVPELNRARTDLEILLEVDTTLLRGEGNELKDLLRLFADAGFYAYRLPNHYDTFSYERPRRIERPTRLRLPAAGVLDLVFSRREAAAL